MGVEIIRTQLASVRTSDGRTWDASHLHLAKTAEVAHILTEYGAFTDALAECVEDAIDVEMNYGFEFDLAAFFRALAENVEAEHGAIIDRIVGEIRSALAAIDEAARTEVVPKRKPQVWVCTDHEGHWPTGVASVVVAPDEETARKLLRDALRERGLEKDRPFTLEALDIGQDHAVVLRNGNY